MVDTHNLALQKSPNAFDRIGMNIASAANIFTHRMAGRRSPRRRPARRDRAGLFATLSAAEHAHRAGARGYCARPSAGRLSGRADCRDSRDREAAAGALELCI